MSGLADFAAGGLTLSTRSDAPKLLLFAGTAALAVAALVFARAAKGPERAIATHEPLLGIALDIETAGNTASSLGPTDACNEVPVQIGQTVDVEVVVRGIPPHEPSTDTHGISAVDGMIRYDRGIVRILDFDPYFMLFRSGVPVPFVHTDPLPDQDGEFAFALVDLSSFVESGDGVLARITFEVVGAPGTALDLTGWSEADPLFLDPSSNPYHVGSVGDATLQIGEQCPFQYNPPDPVPAGTSALFFDSEFQNPFGYGAAKNIAGDDWEFTAVGSPSHVLVRAISDFDEWWVDIAAPDAGQLTQGVYDVVAYPHQQSGQAGLMIAGNGLPACISISHPGQLDVHEAAFAPSGRPTSLSVSFRTGCGGMLFGEIRFNSPVPFTALDVAPSHILDFGKQPAGTVGQAAVTITNTGTTTLDARVLGITGPDSEFQIGNDGCPGAMGPGDNCVVQLVFTPTERGSRWAALEIIDNTERGSRQIQLHGEGTEPFVTFNPHGLDFGWVTVGQTAIHEMTIGNVGLAPLVVHGLTLGGPMAADFRLVVDECTRAVIETGNSCRLAFSFTPSQLFDRYALLEVHSNDPLGSRTLGLRGYGVAYADIAVDARTTPPTVQSGHSTKVRLTVVNNGPDIAYDTHINSYFLAGLRPIKVSTTNGTCDPLIYGVLSCSLGDLESGQRVSLQVVVEVTSSQPGIIPMYFPAYSSSTDQHVENNIPRVDIRVVGRKA